MRQTTRTNNLDARRTAAARHPARPGEVVEAKFGMQYIRGNRRPHFSITGAVYGEDAGVRRTLACGCVHADVVAAHPALAELVAFHLWDQDGVPLHYVENADYWAQLCLGISRWQKSTVQTRPYFEILADQIGAVVLGDTAELAARVELYRRHYEGMTGVLPPSQELARAAFQTWLDGRRPRLRDVFLAAMARHGCELIAVVDTPTAGV